MAISDQQILEELQYVVHEPPDQGATWPCDLWTRAEVVEYLNQRQQRFLKETHLLVSTATLPVGVGDTQIALPADWIRTRRVVWDGSDGVVKEVPRADSFETDYGVSTNAVPQDSPQVYSEFEGPTLTMGITPTVISGTLQLDYVAGAALFTSTPGALLTLPDDFVYVEKYGALAEMFGKDGRANDPARAEYCEMRYALAIDTARLLLNGWA
jgi:hypothetical protein